MRLAPMLALALLAAGCVGAPGPGGPQAGAVLPDLSDVPAPAVDATRARMWWEEFVANTPGRHAGTPTNQMALDMLEAGLQEAGYETRVFYYLPTAVQGNDIPLVGGSPSPVEQGIKTLIGIRKGSVEPEHVVGWVAHYDSNRQTVYAAYDDGSGTSVALELARVMAGYDNRKTLMPIFFDGEEMGLVGSEAFVRQAMGSDAYVFDMVIGHDMTGINCPGHEWPMYQMVAEDFAETLLPIEEAIYRDVMNVDHGFADMETPTEEIEKHCVVILNGHDRNSDERNFKEQGIPIVRMAGGRKAVEYPAYHKANDTIEYVYEFAGGAENYEAGLELTVVASYWNAVTFDRLPRLA